MNTIDISPYIANTNHIVKLKLFFLGTNLAIDSDHGGTTERAFPRPRRTPLDLEIAMRLTLFRRHGGLRGEWCHLTFNH